MFRFIVPALCLLAGTASAKDLKVLTGAGMSMPVKALAADFGKRSGDAVTVVSDTAGGVQKRIEAGEKIRSGHRHRSGNGGLGEGRQGGRRA